MPGHGGLWRQPDFVKPWAGQSLDALSAAVTTLALPLLAALTRNFPRSGLVKFRIWDVCR